ncbi:tetratricopeptide repeat protein [Mastigocoleus testarum]|uniref:Uncharacterized protein n=1 Tax=Mastigocoleus testarum BC008 TaxID=371196 RepID=A0A0V7ZDP6_9CYAN|nr:tetratricopeptide repeat protein [Mastigocoleus testarum]KST62658.1 hypothetical protein BC008_38155 [Mastigocoleus testarum BC008]
MLQFKGYGAIRLDIYELLLKQWRPETDEEVIPFIDTVKTYGDVLQLLDQREEALNYYQDALEYYRQIGAKLGEANTLKAIGDVLQFLDRREEALNHYQDALEYYRQIGAKLGEANILQEFGKLESNPQRSLEYLQQAHTLYLQISDIYSQSRNLQFIADVQLNLGRQDAAISSLAQVSKLASTICDKAFQEYAANKIVEIQNSQIPENLPN